MIDIEWNSGDLHAVPQSDASKVFVRSWIAPSMFQQPSPLSSEHPIRKRTPTSIPIPIMRELCILVSYCDDK